MMCLPEQGEIKQQLRVEHRAVLGSPGSVALTDVRGQVHRRSSLRYKGSEIINDAFRAWKTCSSHL